MTGVESAAVIQPGRPQVAQSTLGECLLLKGANSCDLPIAVLASTGSDGSFVPIAVVPFAGRMVGSSDQHATQICSVDSS